ncbi:MAG TPA: hypothetical protein PKO06_09635 [Candidatus Ozemobacteraceae bacterium]|nr:hypothetical protein [Candidatus Ozemobacteraceae bacterium]
MNNTVKSLVLLLFLSLIALPAFSSPVDELLSISATYELTVLQPLPEAVTEELKLSEQESKLTEQILADQQETEKLTKKANLLSQGMIRRLLNRVQFKINHENRVELKGVMTALSGMSEQMMRGKKKIAYIAGREVNLLDGEWREAPDGRQYWVSNEYPEIILSPAEYRKYAATAVIVTD